MKQSRRRVFTGGRSAKAACLAVLLALLAPPLVLAQQSQERILVPVETKAAGPGQGGPRAARPEMVLQTGLTNPASLIAFSPDGQLLASISLFGGAIKLWEVATGRELAALNLNERATSSSMQGFALAFRPDGLSLISVNSGVARQWDTRTGKPLRTVGLNNFKESFHVRLSPDGALLAAVSGADRSLAVWSTETGQQVQAVTLGADSMNSFWAATFSPDGRTLAALEELRDGRSDVTRLVLRDVASWRVSQTIKVWEGRPGMDVSTSTSVANPGFSSDGKVVAAIRHVTLRQGGGIQGGIPRTVGRDSFLTLWDVASGREIRTIPIATIRREMGIGDEGMTGMLPNPYAFSPDGKQIASVVNERTVKFMDVASGRELGTADANSSILALAFPANGQQLATSSIDNSIKIWNIAALATAGPAVLVRSLGGAAAPVQDLAFSGDGRSLAVSGARAVTAWDLMSGASQRTVALPSKTASALEEVFGSPLTGSFFSPDGQLIAASDNQGNMKLWETRSGREVKSFPVPPAKRVSGGSISADGKMIALADGAPKPGAANQASPPANSPAGAADPAQGQTQTTPPQLPPTPADPKKQKEEEKKREKEARKQAEKSQRQMMEQMMEQMKKGGGRGGGMPAGVPNVDMTKMQEMMDAAQRGELGKVTEIASQMTGSLPGAMAGAAPPAGSIRVLDVGAGNALSTLPTTANLANTESFLAFSPDGRALASATGGRSIKVNEVATGRELATLAPDRGMYVQGLAWSPNGRLLAAGVMETKPGVNINTSDFSMDAMFAFPLKLWDVAGARELFSLTGHNTWVTTLAFSPDGATLASAGGDARVKIWDTATGRELLTLSGHSQLVTTLAFSPDGAYLASGSIDGSTRLWEAKTGELLATLVSVNEGADWLVMTPDGLFDGTPAAWGQILWRFSPNITDVAPVEIFFNEFFHPGLLNEIYAGKRPKAAKDVSLRDRRQPAVTLARGGGQTAVDSAARTITVRVEVSEPPPVAGAANAAPAGARDVRLFRNGTLVKTWRGDVLQGKRQVSLEATVPVVAGENRLVAYAFNRDNVKSADAVLSVTGDTRLQRKGVAYVLAFGVNRYANDQYNLKYAVADVKAFAEELRAQQVKLQNFERVEVIELTDSQATKENILIALRRLASADAPLPAAAPAALAKVQTAQPEDAVVIYFAGHGTAQGARFYLVPHDLGYSGPRNQLDAAGVQTILAHSISDLELEEAVAGLDAAQLLLVIDACNSGQALEAEEKRRGPMNSKGLAQLAYEKGMYILTAAQSYQAALEAVQLGHGYLTFALVEEGLKKGAADRDAKDGAILTREWFDYATERVPQMQEKEMGARLLLQQDVAFVEGEEKIKDPSKRSKQRPRVFYRREVEARPLVVARP